MQNKLFKYFLFFSFFLIFHFSLNAQFYHNYKTGRNFKPSTFDSVQRLVINRKIQTTLTKVCQLKYIEAISIDNRYQAAVIIPFELSKIRPMYNIEMFKCKNDSMFTHFKALYGITYRTKYFNPKLLLNDSLFDLRVGVKKGKISNILSKPNNLLRLLQIRTKDEQFLDSSYLNLKALTSLELNFNPFILGNYSILSHMDSLKEIMVIKRNFRHFLIDETTLALFSKYKIRFVNCQFTISQKKLLSSYKNIERTWENYISAP